MNGTEFVDGQMEGRVEVCSDNAYFTVCNDFWDALEANVVCRYLGHNTSSVSDHSLLLFASYTVYVTVTGNVPVRSAARVYGLSEVMIHLDNLACQGNEMSLLECSSRDSVKFMHECSNSDVAGVICGGK